MRPRLYNFDFSIAKKFRLAEARELQFRSEFFNGLNHPQFGLPNATIGVADAGTITSYSTFQSPDAVRIAPGLLRRELRPTCRPCGSRQPVHRCRPVLQYDRPTF